MSVDEKLNYYFCSIYFRRMGCILNYYSVIIECRVR